VAVAAPLPVQRLHQAGGRLLPWRASAGRSGLDGLARRAVGWQSAWLLLLDGQVHHDTRVIPMGNYVSADSHLHLGLGPLQVRRARDRERRVRRVRPARPARLPRRVADGDVEALSLMLGLFAEIDTAISQAVTGLRAFGYSWAEIGSRLGVTRQAAQQRWGHAS
jgi:hypothetical protein